MNNHDNGRVRGLFHAVAMIVAFVCAAACALAVALGAGVAVAHADETGRAGGTGTIELKYEYQGESLEGDGVSLYRVADWDGGAFTLRDEYADADFGTDARGWDGLMDDLKEGKASAEQFQAAANTLDAYVRAEGIEATQTGTIYGLGASFSEPGVRAVQRERQARVGREGVFQEFVRGDSGEPGDHAGGRHQGMEGRHAAGASRVHPGAADP